MAVGNPLLKLLGIRPQIIQAPGISSPAMAAAVIAAGALGSIGVGGNRPGCFVRFREVDCGTPVTDMGAGLPDGALALKRFGDRSRPKGDLRWKLPLSRSLPEMDIGLVDL
jgi:hypothetical protein